MFGDVLRSRKVQIGLALLLVGLLALFLKPGRENPARTLPQIPAMKTPESVAPPPSNVRAQSAAAMLNIAIEGKIDSIIRLIDEMTE